MNEAKNDDVLVLRLEPCDAVVPDWLCCVLVEGLALHGVVEQILLDLTEWVFAEMLVRLG